MKLKPIGERIVIKKIEAEETTESGFVLPDSAKEEPQYAEVVAIGQGVENEDDYKGLLKVGDKVVYSKYSGTEVSLDDEDYIVVKMEDVLAIVED